MGAAGIWLIPTFGDLGPCTLFRPRGEISPKSGNVECAISGHLVRIATSSRSHDGAARADVRGW